MAKPVTIRASARIELMLVHERYDSLDAAVGDRFLATIERLQALLSTEPEAGQVWRKRRGGPPLRRFPLRRFPFVVFYQIGDDAVDIVAFAHGRRRPGYFLRRMRREEQG